MAQQRCVDLAQRRIRSEPKHATIQVPEKLDELRRDADYYVLLREQFELKRGELAKTSRRIELIEKLIALEEADGATIEA
jgi:hypothetical protein